MTPDDLQAFLEANSIEAEIVRLKAHTPTVETAAAAVGAQPEQIIKSLLFMVDGSPVLAIACGPQRLDYRRIAAHYNTGRRRVKFADATTVERITGYPAGGVPPFGHPEPLSTLIDPLVLEQPFVYGGGGDDHSLLRIRPQVLQEITRAEIVPLVKA